MGSFGRTTAARAGQPVPAFPEPCVTCLAFAPGTGARPIVAAGTAAGVAFSRDGGETWTLEAPELGPILSVAFAEDAGGLAILAGTDRRRHRSATARRRRLVARQPGAGRPRHRRSGGQHGVRAGAPAGGRDASTPASCSRTTPAKPGRRATTASPTSRRPRWRSSRRRTASPRSSRRSPAASSAPRISEAAGAPSTSVRRRTPGSPRSTSPATPPPPPRRSWPPDPAACPLSFDGGAAWQALPLPRPGAEIVGAAGSPDLARDRTVYAVVRATRIAPDGSVEPAGLELWRSDDLGQHWTQWLALAERHRDAAGRPPRRRPGVRRPRRPRRARGPAATKRAGSPARRAAPALAGGPDRQPRIGRHGPRALAEPAPRPAPSWPPPIPASTSRAMAARRSPPGSTAWTFRSSRPWP